MALFTRDRKAVNTSVKYKSNACRPVHLWVDVWAGDKNQHRLKYDHNINCKLQLLRILLRTTSEWWETVYYYFYFDAIKKTTKGRNDQRRLCAFIQCKYHIKLMLHQHRAKHFFIITRNTQDKNLWKIKMRTVFKQLHKFTSSTVKRWMLMQSFRFGPWKEKTAATWTASNSFVTVHPHLPIDI